MYYENNRYSRQQTRLLITIRGATATFSQPVEASFPGSKRHGFDGVVTGVAQSDRQTREC